MKANKKFIEDNASSHIADTIFLVIIIGLCAMLVTVEVGRAIIPVLIGIGCAWAAGAIVGWFLAQQQDTGSPNALVTSEYDFVITWEDFLEEWNNSYIQINTDLTNYMNIYNFTYLQQVRRAENEVSAFVSYDVWQDVVANMTTLQSYRENVTKSLIGMLHSYNRLDASIISYLYDTADLVYAQPVKATQASQLLWNTNPIWRPISAVSTGNYQYKLQYGTFPVGYSGNYSIGDSLYITFMYVPSGKYIVLNNTATGIETNYSTAGVKDIQGALCEIVDVSTDANYGTGFDGTEVYVWGMPDSFNFLEAESREYLISETWAGGGGKAPGVNDTLEFGSYKNISYIWVFGQIGNHYHVYVDGAPFESGVIAPSGDPTHSGVKVNINQKVKMISEHVDETHHQITAISTTGFYYNNYMNCYAIQVNTTDDGKAYIVNRGFPNANQSNLQAINAIGIWWMADSYIGIYDAMMNNSEILWNLYHANGWYNTSDIPSEFMVVPPDVIFDNLDALTNLPMNASQAIYYAWMYQLINYYNENPNSTAVYDDNNQTMYDLGIRVNATLVHGANTVFNESWVYVSPLLSDFEICSNNSYNLTQGLFIFEPDGRHVYNAYTGDNFTVYNITLDGNQVDCITLGHQTMSEYMLAEYGFNLSFAGEWIFPEVGTDNLYTMLSVVAICAGIMLYVFGRFGKEQHGFLKIIGILLMLAGFVYLAYIYIVAPILNYFGWLL